MLLGAIVVGLLVGGLIGLSGWWLSGVGLAVLIPAALAVVVAWRFCLLRRVSTRHACYATSHAVLFVDAKSGYWLIDDHHAWPRGASHGRELRALLRGPLWAAASELGVEIRADVRTAAVRDHYRREGFLDGAIETNDGDLWRYVWPP